MLKRRRLIVGNWKMNGRMTSGTGLARAIAAQAVAQRPLTFDSVVCPPATLIWSIAETVMGTPVMVGAQDCHTENQGAFTGDVSAGMLADLGCRFVILGHSERRLYHHESDALVAAKVTAAQTAGLVTIVCLGESHAERERGETEGVIVRQLTQSIPSHVNASLLVVAYEPVWAIGSGRIPEVEEISQVHNLIRETLGEMGATTRILYGGSVTAQNASSLFRERQIDGVLVGGASLDAESFWTIAMAGGTLA